MQLVTRRHHATAWSDPLPDLDGPSTLVLVFGPSEGGPAALAELRRAYPNSVHAGCSSAGEIFGDRVADGTLSVAIARFEHTRLRKATTEVTAASESRGAGRRLAETLAAPDLAYVLVLSDGLLVNGTELVRGLSEVLRPEVVVTGGLAGDGARFQRTWVLADDGPESGRITAVGFYGDRLRVGHGSKGGWDIFGPERTVTRSEGNVLYELDGRPALALYKEYLGERASGCRRRGSCSPSRSGAVPTTRTGWSGRSSRSTTRSRRSCSPGTSPRGGAPSS